MCGVVRMVLHELQVLHAITLNVKGTGDQVKNANGNAEVARRHADLATIA